MKMKRLLLSLFALVIIGVFTTRANCTTDDNVVKKEIVVNQDKSDYDRSDPYSIKVYYLPLSSEIEVNCLDQGGLQSTFSIPVIRCVDMPSSILR